MRLRGWEDRLTAVIERHLALPPEYGVSDCFVIADDGVEACLGQRLHQLAGQPPVTGYKSELGAARLLRRRGFNGVSNAFGSVFAEVPPALAQRGDVGVVEHEGVEAGGLFTQLGFFTRIAGGPAVFLPASAARIGYRVG